VLDIKKLILLSEIINIKALCEKAGLNHNTISQKMRRGTELNVKESSALNQVLWEYCDYLTAN